MRIVTPTQFNEIIGRLERFGITKQDELAEVLGMSQSGVSTSKKRNCFPYHWTELLCKRYKINPSYLIYGKEDPENDAKFWHMMKHRRGNRQPGDLDDYGYTQNRQVDTFNNTPDNRKSLIPATNYTEDADTMLDTIRNLNEFIADLKAKIAQKDREIEMLKGELKKGTGNR